MNTKSYFDKLKTVEEIKAHYKALARKYHPDLGGCTETMQEINAQYHKALESCHGQEYKDSDFTYQYKQEIEQQIIDILNKLFSLDMEGVNVALIGTWLWVDGDTKKIKEDLKALGFRWNRNRETWQFNPNPSKKRWSSSQSVDDLAHKYGYKNFKKKAEKEEKRSNSPYKLRNTQRLQAA